MLVPQICINRPIHPDAVPPIHAVSYHVATYKPPSKDGDKVISTKLAAAIFGGSCTEEVFCRPSTAPVARTTCIGCHENNNFEGAASTLTYLPFCVQVERMTLKTTER